MVDFGLFDTVPESMLETLLVVHGSGDRDHPQFTQVCERWTCILSPWVRTPKTTTWPYGRKRARWIGKYFCWYPTGQLYQKGRCCKGDPESIWWRWYKNTQLLETGTHRYGWRHGVWQKRYQAHHNGRVSSEGVYINGSKEGMWQFWWDNGQLRSEGMYRNGLKHGVWKRWRKTGLVLLKYVYTNGRCEKQETRLIRTSMRLMGE